MNRVQKKCLVGSMALHGLLVGIVFVGPAFLSRKPQPPNLPLITVIPSRLIDEAFYGGGNPNGRLPAPPPAQPQPATPAPAPEPAPAPPAPAPEPARAPSPSRAEPPASEPQPNPRTRPAVAEPSAPVAKPESPKAAPARNPIRVNKDLVSRNPGERTTAPTSKVRVGSPTQNRSDAQARNKAAAEVRSGVSSLVDRLASNLSSGTSIEPFGPGGGGEVYANWFQVVQSLYDAAWRDPAEVTDELATVRVRVRVSRDGTVLADDIVKRTDIRALDQSVQEALDRVRARGLPRLPESARESERTFYINFNLKSKRQPG